MRSKKPATCLLAILPLALLLTACGKDYSPNTYASSAVQQASKVESGVVVGVRKVTISADPTVASATGAAAGGIAGSQVAEGAYSALGALGGAVVGGLAGSEAGHKMQDTYGYEYIVRNGKGDLLSVTQKDVTPLKIGQRVLLIQGSQARIVDDYTEHVDTDMQDKPNAQKSDMSKAASGANKDSGPLQTPAPNAQGTMEQLTGAAAAAAVTAITAEGMKDKDKDAAPAPASPSPSGATPAPAGTTIVAQPDAATEPAEAAPVSAPAVEAPAPAAPAATAPIGTPAPSSPQPTTQPKPAPSATVVVPAPTQQTKSGTATTSPGTAPATGTGVAPAKETPKKEAAPAAKEDAAPADGEQPAEGEKKPEDAEPAAASQPSKPAPAQDAPKSDAPKTDAAPATPDKDAAH
ncbi:MAG: hypothetical protein V4441_13430 [Pseudomonadota bacterium]